MTIVINRPEKKNSLTWEMYDSLAQALEQADHDQDVNAIVLQGKGGCFCAGNDLSGFASPPSVDETPASQRFIQQIATTKKPLIAIVEGQAVGIGTTMLLHCDLIYAGTNATFSLPFVNLGLTPEAASSYLLPKLIGHQKASELLLLGEAFSAETAYEIGLVNQVFPESSLYTDAMEKVQALVRQPVAAVMATKKLLKNGAETVVNETILEELTIFTERMRSPEFAEIINAFLHSRKA
jgi:enoyl-CoA hydratase/carnithine racemase